MSKRGFSMVCLWVLASSVACGRTDLGHCSPGCGQTGRDARGPDLDDASVTGDVTGDGASPEAAANCGTVKLDLQSVPKDLLIVLDRSQSTALSSTEDAACVAGSGCSSRAQVLGTTLELALESGKYVRWGLKLYPSPGAGACEVGAGVEVELALDAPAAIEAVIDDLVPAGSAPVGQALRQAGQYLQTVTDGYFKAVLLATSGTTACAVPDATADAGLSQWSAAELDAIQAARELHDMNIPVVVISFDVPTHAGVEPYLDALASAGGTTTYYPASDPYALLDSLFPPVDFPMTCSLSLAYAPPVPDNVTVTLNGELVPRDPAQLEGWDLVNPKLITFFGSYCEKMLQLKQLSIEIVFGCP